jgi:hypothetical protein
MFRATMGPSSGETTVFLRHLVLVILCGWRSGMQGMFRPTMDLSSGETTVFFDTWYLLFCVDDDLVCRVCFGRLWAYYREKQLCFATLGICYSVWMTIWYAGYISGDYGSFIRRNNCVFATLCTCYSVLMMIWYAGYAPCIPDRHPRRITSTKCRKNTVVSPDDRPIVAQNM